MTRGDGCKSIGSKCLCPRRYSPYQDNLLLIRMGQCLGPGQKGCDANTTREPDLALGSFTENKPSVDSVVTRYEIMVY